MKRTKQSSENLPSIDRLSALPEGIICHILSFLPTKASLSTSILARRWRFLWAHVPNLNFDTRDHFSETSFLSIITRVMFLHKVQRINTFRLYYEDNCSQYEFTTLIIVVISRNVRILDISIDCHLMLPCCVFTCKTLVDLRLEDCVINSLTGNAVYLPCLKMLRLFDVTYHVGENLAKLFNGFPVLEELLMSRSEEDGLVGCKIFSPTIKKIVLNFPYDPSAYQNHEFKVELNTPALIDLRLTDFVSTHISSQMITSLTQVDVDFNYDPDVGEADKYFRSMVKFIFSLSNMKCLKLAFPPKFEPAGSFADGSQKSIRKLDNLKKLELDGSWSYLTNILACADNLEVLIIHEVARLELGHWMKPEKVPTCLLSHLRSVRIDEFRYECEEFKMVKYILRNARVLKRMEIVSQLFKSVEEKFEALQSISLFHRASETCELAFY